MKPILEFREHIESLYPNLRTNILEVGSNPTWMLEIFTSESRIDVVWGEGLRWGIAELNAENEDDSWFNSRNDVEFDTSDEALSYVHELIEKRESSYPHFPRP